MILLFPSLVQFSSQEARDCFKAKYVSVQMLPILNEVLS